MSSARSRSSCAASLAAAIILAGTASTSLAQTILKSEPAMGALREGQRVLVDDGSCGPGQIKEVIGGNHVKVGGTKDIVRQRRCIARPK
jgi:Family of unknown function (DUF6719)